MIQARASIEESSMHTPIGLLFLASVVLLAGCGNASQPLASGTVIDGTMWDSPPLPGPHSRGGLPLKGAHVDVYEHVVVATDSDGGIHVAPVDWCSPLTLKK
jgi:hypothetical protein